MLSSCTQSQNYTAVIQKTAIKDTSSSTIAIQRADTSNPAYMQTGNTTPDELVAYAQTLIGIPYKYASTDPRQGFDCSGFITYVFNHFGITVPRSSVGFTNAPHTVLAGDAKPGDIILFTGTDSTIRVPGHMGIITSKENNEFFFIHSTSGKVYGVTITSFNAYYKSRFLKVLRVFPQNDLNN